MGTARIQYQRGLQQVRDDVLVLGSMVGEAVLEATDALKRRDRETAQRLINYDRAINKRRFEIEDNVLTIIATQQPAAGDLRFLAAVLEISTELERVGDYAKGISKIVLLCGPEPLIKLPPEIPAMAEKAMDMLRRALDAFANEDADTAEQIPLEDDEVDALYNKCARSLLDAIIANPKVVDQANYLSWAAHNLERAADRVTNICERILYNVRGAFVEFDADEPDRSGIN
jgi:phosphate transport system protein